MLIFSRIRSLRITAYIIITLIGIAQAWANRHVIFSDGISYVEIATAYVHGDWTNAINAYWSPFYSWLLAVAFWILRPGRYWQAATLHLVNLLMYFVSLTALEFFMRELLLFRRSSTTNAGDGLSDFTLYAVAYTVFPLATLGLIQYNSPDMVSVALTFLLTALILQVKRTGGAWWTFLSIGVFCAFFFLARTGFAPLIPACLFVVLALRWQQSRSLLYPALGILLTVVALSGPFVAAISLQKGRLTLGESGRLTYGWEVNGASRFTHWQGEPYDIGKPLHPTKRVSQSPMAYVFDGPVDGAYPPWHDPSYWYEGIKPKLKPALEAQVFAIDLILVLKLLAASPITLPALLLILQMGVLAWLRRFFSFWPVWAPIIAGFLLYCLVYVEKRYIASNLMIIWLVIVASIGVREGRWRRWGDLITQAFCLVFFSYFLYSRVIPPAGSAIWDLLHWREHDKNMYYLEAERLKQIGLRPGDKVAFVGMSTNADWARLDQVKVIGEVPVIWKRPQQLLNNYLIEDSSQIEAFWKADAATRGRVLQAFHDAGAVMAVTDGLFVDELSEFPPEWRDVFSPEQISALKEGNEDDEFLSKVRYIWLK